VSVTELVCLSRKFDFKAMFGDAFARHAPGLRLVSPDEADPAQVRFALANDPAPDAFEVFRNLRLICTWGAGVNDLLRHPGLPRDVAIKRMTDPGQAQMMAAFAAHYVTGWQRRMFDYPARQQQRLWDRNLNDTAPRDFPVGILGYGKMGEAIGKGLAAMGFPVTAWASRARDAGGVAVVAGQAGFDRVVSTSAALINVLPLTPETAGILCAPVFAAMRDDAILIQLARGAHVVEPDLIAALDAGRPALAALDVMVREPLPPDDPLWAHPRVMLTPHIASAASPEGVARSVADGIAAFERGDTPEGLVDIRRGY
jgi:glyoxylate/hydroxypyruvate reductase A